MAETTFKTLIERFRSRPEWQHPDPAVRAEAVLKLPASDHELLLMRPECSLHCGQCIRQHSALKRFGTRN